MSAFIEQLIRWGEAGLPIAQQFFWQTSLLIVVLLALDLVLRNRVRAGFRYALWMLLLVKLVLPPTISLPTGVGYWIDRSAREAPQPHPVATVPKFEVTHPTVTTDSTPFQNVPNFEPRQLPMEAVQPPAPKLTRNGWLIATWLSGILLLLGWMLWRWRWVNRIVKASMPAEEELQQLAIGCVQTLGSARSNVLPASRRQNDRLQTCPTLRLTGAPMSPAVCGLFRPVILLPRQIVERLSTEQLRTVLLHELIHLRRRDLWVNCLQTLLQIGCWWHPLLWLANARIRRVREEAVDEAVASALRDNADAYPATLLEVAKLTFTRPLMTLGLVGILESKNALKQRIRRLLDRQPLESTRLKWWQWTTLVAFALAALPMAQGKSRSAPANSQLSNSGNASKPIGGHGLDANQAVQTPAPNAELITRTFRVNPNTFYRGLEGVLTNPRARYSKDSAVDNGTTFVQVTNIFQANPNGGVRFLTTTNNMSVVTVAARDYFEAAGVKLAAPKMVYFNDRTGQLLVRATAEDMEIIQRAVEMLNYEPPKVTIEGRYVELKSDDVRALGFDWFAGKATKPSGNSQNSGIAQVTGILTEPQYRMVIKALEGRKGVDVKFAPRITTLSGRQTQIYLTNPPTAEPQQMSQLADAFGSFLDFIPNVAPDGKSIQMTILPTFIEPLNPGDPQRPVFVAPPTVDEHSARPDADHMFRDPRSRSGTASTPLPQFRRHQIETTANIWDGQTIVLSATSDPAKKNDAGETTQGIWFITPTIVKQSTDSLGRGLKPSAAKAAAVAVSTETSQANEPGPSSKQGATSTEPPGDRTPSPRLSPKATTVIAHSAEGTGNTRAAPIQIDAIAVKLIPEAWAALIKSEGVRALDGKAGTYVDDREPGILLGWLKQQSGATILFAPRVTTFEHRPTTLTVRPAIQYPDELRSGFEVKLEVWRHEARPGEFALTADATMTDAGQLTADGKIVPLRKDSSSPLTTVEESSAVHSVNAVGYVNHTINADAIGVREDRWAIITNPQNRGTNEPVFAVALKTITVEPLGDPGTPEPKGKESARAPTADQTTGNDVRRRMVEVEKAWVQPITRKKLPQPNDYARRDPQVYTSVGRHEIMEKLNKISIEELKYEGLPLSEVVKNLSDEARRRDPEEKGINFMVVSNIDNAQAPTTFATDPATGAPIAIATPGAEARDLGSTIIDINPPLTNLRLIDALNAIVMAADQRIKYTVEEFAVVFSQKTPEAEHLEVRTFRVNPNTFYQGMEGVLANSLSGGNQNGGGGDQNGDGSTRFLTRTNVNIAVRNYFEAAGVSLLAPKMLFFNDRTGILMVKATAEDLEVIQRAVEVLNYEPPQITIDVRMFQVTKDAVRAIGLDPLVNLLPDENSKTEKKALAVLTESQLTTVTKTLDGEPDAGFLGFPRVTTLSGRPTDLKATATTNVVTAVTLSADGTTYKTQDIEVGATVALSPFVLDDGYTIDLNANVSLVQFLGYDDPATQGLPKHVPLPHITRQSIRQSARIWDGQTLVLGGVTTEQQMITKDKVPLLGDLPWIGRLYRKENKFTETKQVLVFITPRIVDPAGNQVHKPEEMPFAKEAVPSQPSAK